MAVGKIKIEGLIKILLLLIFIIFFIQNLINNDLSNESINVPKDNSYRVIIAGGSNVMYGLQAESFQNSFGNTLNLSLASEGGTFFNYSNWLKKLNVHSHLVIYSPISFWDVKENEFEDANLIQKFQSLFPKISLIRYIVNLFTPPSNIYTRNTFGDLTEFNCKNDIPNWIFSANYVKRALLASKKFKTRMAIIRDATQADIVVLRIPPLLVSSINKFQIEKDIRGVIASYRDQGILVLEEPILTSIDTSLFCDYSHHPNQAGRAFFTENYLSALKKLPLP